MIVSANCNLITNINDLVLAPSVPRNPQVTNTSKTSLQLQWMEPQTPNGIILHYRVSITVLYIAI